jgi:hypothetical protein
LHDEPKVDPASRAQLRTALPADTQFALAARAVVEQTEPPYVLLARLQQLPTPWPSKLTLAVASRAEAEIAARPGESTPFGPALVAGCADADLQRIAALPNLPPVAAATLQARLLLSQLMPDPPGEPHR